VTVIPKSAADKEDIQSVPGFEAGLSYHGFYGLESEVVPKIVNFIQAH
jgi:hypothetical protein